MRALESAPSWEAIDVYSDMIPAHGQRFGGQRRQPIPAPTGALEHGYRDPAPPAAPIERPTIWAESTALAESVLHRLEERLDGEGLTAPKRRSARIVGTAVLLDWLARYDGDSWQQRWLASDLDDAAGGWAAQVTDPRLHAKAAGRYQLLQGASALVVSDVIRPSYRWLHAFQSPRTWALVRAEHDPEGFARLAVLGRTLEGFSVNDEPVRISV